MSRKSAFGPPAFRKQQPTIRRLKAFFLSRRPVLGESRRETALSECPPKQTIPRAEASFLRQSPYRESPSRETTVSGGPKNLTKRFFCFVAFFRLWRLFGIQNALWFGEA
jgi:hypothetical protein